MITMEEAAIKKCRAILCFGPMTDATGTRAGAFYQATIDPAFMSPGGEYIRFGAYEADEIHGWQKISNMTVCEVLGVYNDDGTYPTAPGEVSELRMMVVKDELHTP